VTRGSFYWHFADLDAFHRDLLAHWVDGTSSELLRATVRDGDARLQLRGMLRRALRAHADVERAMRGWAMADPRVAEAVAAVDWRRLRFAEQLLAAIGVPERHIRPRARLLYWAAIGRLMMARPGDRPLTESDIDGLADLVSDAETR
jgi:AcrR family transcriptional regulator